MLEFALTVVFVLASKYNRSPHPTAIWNKSNFKMLGLLVIIFVYVIHLEFKISYSSVPVIQFKGTFPWLKKIWVMMSCCCCKVTSVVCDSVRPHRRQLTRLPHPWDSPGKNTGVGSHFLELLDFKIFSFFFFSVFIYFEF